MRFRIRAGRAMRALAVASGLSLTALGINSPAAYAGVGGTPVDTFNQVCGPGTGRAYALPTDHIIVTMTGLNSDFQSADVTWTIGGTSHTSTATFDPDGRNATAFFNPVLTSASSDLQVTYRLNWKDGSHTDRSMSGPLRACARAADYQTVVQADSGVVAASFSQQCSRTSDGVLDDYVIVRTAPGLYSTAQDLDGDPVWANYWFDGGPKVITGVTGYSDVLGKASVVFRVDPSSAGKLLIVRVFVGTQSGNWPVLLYAPLAC